MEHRELNADLGNLENILPYIVNLNEKGLIYPKLKNPNDLILKLSITYDESTSSTNAETIFFNDRGMEKKAVYSGYDKTDYMDFYSTAMGEKYYLVYFLSKKRLKLDFNSKKDEVIEYTELAGIALAENCTFESDQ